jgi:hypothetical protein
VVVASENPCHDLLAFSPSHPSVRSQEHEAARDMSSLTENLGLLVQEGLPYLTSDWWVSFFPGLTVALVALGFVFLEDALIHVLNPRLRSSLVAKPVQTRLDDSPMCRNPWDSERPVFLWIKATLPAFSQLVVFDNTKTRGVSLFRRSKATSRNPSLPEYGCFSD